MRIIRQRFQNDCAIASACMLTGMAYRKVFKAIHQKRTTQKIIGTTLKKLLSGLLRLGFKYQVSTKKIDIGRLKQNAYISVNTFYGERHAVVWDAKKKVIVDPKSAATYIDKRYAKKNMNFVVFLTKEK